MWLVIGIIVGAAILGLYVSQRSKGIGLSWYTWLIGIIGLVLLLFTIQNFTGSLKDNENTPAYMFLLITGIPSVTLLVVTWILAIRQTKTA